MNVEEIKNQIQIDAKNQAEEAISSLDELLNDYGPIVKELVELLLSEEASSLFYEITRVWSYNFKYPNNILDKIIFLKSFIFQCFFDDFSICLNVTYQSEMDKFHDEKESKMPFLFVINELYDVPAFTPESFLDFCKNFLKEEKRKQIRLEKFQEKMRQIKNKDKNT